MSLLQDKFSIRNHPVKCRLVQVPTKPDLITVAATKIRATKCTAVTLEEVVDAAVSTITNNSKVDLPTHTSSSLCNGLLEGLLKQEINTKWDKKWEDTVPIKDINSNNCSSNPSAHQVVSLITRRSNANSICKVSLPYQNK